MNDSCRRPDRRRPVRHVAKHDRIGPDHAIAPDTDRTGDHGARKDHRIIANEG